MALMKLPTNINLSKSFCEPGYQLKVIHGQDRKHGESLICNVETVLICYVKTCQLLMVFVHKNMQ